MILFLNRVLGQGFPVSIEDEANLVAIGSDTHLLHAAGHIESPLLKARTDSV